MHPMKRTADLWPALFRAAVLGASGVSIAAFLAVGVARLAYPYEAEWVEGGLADEVAVILRGQMPYAAPSLHAVAFIYPPLYFYVSAALSALSGAAGFGPLRAVSLAASLATFALIYALVRQAGARRAAGFVAVGLFAATFKIGGDWLVLARVDALFLALFLAGVYALQRAPGLGNGAARGYSLAGALLALSLLTKQSALPMAAPLAAYAVLADRRRGWLLPASIATLALAAGAGFNLASQGWFAYYVLSGAASQPLQPDVWLIVLRQDLLPLAPLLLVVLAYLALAWRAGRPVGLWTVLLAGTAGTGLWVLLHLGAVQNNLLPLFAALAVVGGLALDGALAWVVGQPGLARAAAPVLIYGVCLWQLGQLAYNPLHRLPDAASRQAAAALVQRLAALPGEAYLPQHGVVAGLAGKPAFAHLAAIDDVLAIGGPAAAQLRAEVQTALRQRRFAAILVDGGAFEARFPELQQNYRVADTLSSGGFFNVRAPAGRPVSVYVPK